MTMNKSTMKQMGVTVILFMLTIASLFWIAGQTHQAYAADIPSYIKVGLYFDSTAKDSVTLSTDNGFQLGTATSDGVEETMPLPAYNQVVATVENGQVVLRDPNGVLLSNGMGNNDCIMPTDYEGSGLVALDGKHYRGGVMFRVNNNNKITVINYLPLEYYVYGVLNNEMGGNYPMEALKAQAVAARSYAAVNTGLYKSKGFDVCGTIQCQVYSGYDGENPNTNEAVDETKGMLLYSDGKPVTAFYFKNSGGHTQNSEDVWSTKEDYLRGVEDPYSPDYSWTATISFADLQSKLEAANYHPGNIQSVAITKRNSAGAVQELTVVGDQDTVVLKKESVRTVLGGSQVRSTMFDMEGDVISNPSSDDNSNQSGDNSNQSGDNSNQSGGTDSLFLHGSSGNILAGNTLYLLNGGGIVSQIKRNQINVFNGKDLRQITKNMLGIGDQGPLTGALTQTTSDPIILHGKGIGHGVGMPQDSAIAMAKQGKTYDEILKFYYTGAEIRTN